MDVARGTRNSVPVTSWIGLYSTVSKIPAAGALSALKGLEYSRRIRPYPSLSPSYGVFGLTEVHPPSTAYSLKPKCMHHTRIRSNPFVPHTFDVFALTQMYRPPTAYLL